VNIDVFKYFCNIFNQTPNFFVLIPDLATPVAHAFTKATALSWLKLRQVWLFIGLLISSKKASILFFDTIQQNMIEGLPVCFIWEAKNYYKATINGNDVTFDKTPVVNSDCTNGRFELTVHGLFSSASLPLILQVKKHEKIKKVQPFRINYTEKTSRNFKEIEKSLVKISKAKFSTKNTSLNSQVLKRIKLSLLNNRIFFRIRNEQVFDQSIIKSLKSKSFIQN
jgi:hypothetical protein